MDEETRIVDCLEHKQKMSRELPTPQDRIRLVRGTRLASEQPGGEPNGFYARVGKRILDLSGAALVLVFAWPVLLLSAVMIWLDSRGPIFYRQSRVGQHGRPFQIVKLRTMIEGADQQGLQLTATGDRRITRVGKLLRKMKWDEIPQMLNVLRGEMSLVGPRPETPEHTAQYTPEEKKVLRVKPGVTGRATLAYVDEEQLLARSVDKETFYIHTLMRRKLQMDLAYCRKLSFLEDLKILFLTAAALVHRSTALQQEIEVVPQSEDLIA
jgi:lipopolysaccharide/colanic/teichoic acid biosynthesis glycosyltransferase